MSRVSLSRAIKNFIVNGKTETGGRLVKGEGMCETASVRFKFRETILWGIKPNK